MLYGTVFCVHQNVNENDIDSRDQMCCTEERRREEDTGTERRTQRQDNREIEKKRQEKRGEAERNLRWGPRGRAPLRVAAALFALCERRVLRRFALAIAFHTHCVLVLRTGSQRFDSIRLDPSVTLVTYEKPSAGVRLLCALPIYGATLPLTDSSV